VKTFEDFREVARQLLLCERPPDSVQWEEGGQTELPTGNYRAVSGKEAPAQRVARPFTVPPTFVRSGAVVAAHRDPSRWALLYRILWRLTHGERSLLLNPADDEVLQFLKMEKQVRHDLHKMHAHVRFRRVLQGGEEWYVAWYRPDHYIVGLAKPFFVERFASMKWAILTPDESVWWDGERATSGEGMSREAANIGEDAVEELWKTYYGAIFNPARVNLKVMRQHMPARHWATLPEAQEIPRLLAEAPGRVHEMARRNVEWPTARAYLPEHDTLPALREAACHCRGCPLFQQATQTVFGEGVETARLVLVGEQPGNDEDLSGRPFVGPAGKILDEVLAEAGIDRSAVYITNAVKHFKWEPRDKIRMHQKPNAMEILACRPWLEAEIARIRPEAIVCLGATAASSVMGPTVRLTRDHGQWRETELCPRTLATFHPSTVLRAATHAASQQKRQEIVEDLRCVARMLVE
jgi:probable DNA metabolism protein